MVLIVHGQRQKAKKRPKRKDKSKTTGFLMAILLLGTAKAAPIPVNFDSEEMSGENSEDGSGQLNTRETYSGSIYAASYFELFDESDRGPIIEQNFGSGELPLKKRQFNFGSSDLRPDGSTSDISFDPDSIDEESKSFS